MDNQLSATAAVTTEPSSGLLADHVIYVFFDFPCADHMHGELLKLTPEAIDRHETLGLIHGDRKNDQRPRTAMFVEGHLTLSSDLHDGAVAALRRSRLGPLSSRDAACLRLSDRGRAILNGDWVRPPGDPRMMTGYTGEHGLVHELPKEAAARVGLNELRVEIVDLMVVELADRLGLVVLELRLPGPRVGLELLEDALHALCHTRRHASLSWAAALDRTARFGLDTLVSEILKPVGCVPQTWNRLYAYTFAQVERLPEGEAASIQAWRVSSHFTRAYHPGPDYAAHTGSLRTFADIIHMGSIEGAVTLAGRATTFHATGLRDRIRTNYLPLAILAYHEQVQLLELAQGVALFDPNTQLRSVLDRFLVIRLRLHLPVVSDVAAHTQFYQMLRTGLMSEALTSKIMVDAAEMDRRLVTTTRAAAQRREHAREASRRRRERTYAPVLGLFAGMLTFLTSLTALKEVRQEFHETFAGAEHLPLFAALALAGLSFVLTVIRHRGAHANGVEHEAADDLEEERQEELTTEGVLGAAEGAAHRAH